GRMGWRRWGGRCSTPTSSCSCIDEHSLSRCAMPAVLSPASLHLLQRRHFLAHLASGLSGVALAQLLAEQGNASERTPFRPAIHPEAPLAARKPPQQAKAKRVLHIFCSGACSHLDTWDYKPQLAKRDGQPLPGAEGLVTFQGANGNLAAS